MSDGVQFEAYLSAKKIDSEAFRKAEPDVWKAWKIEFEQIHPNSFTFQKLNVINAVRRRYRLADVPDKVSKPAVPANSPVQPARPMPGKPVIRRPKTDPGSTG